MPLFSPVKKQKISHRETMKTSIINALKQGHSSDLQRDVRFSFGST
jgi:hypothetical protein